MPPSDDCRFPAMTFVPSPTELPELQKYKKSLVYEYVTGKKEA